MRLEDSARLSAGMDVQEGMDALTWIERNGAYICGTG